MRTIKAQVHRLKGNSRNLYLATDSLNNKILSDKVLDNTEFKLWESQHLYFTTDEEIKDGDWCIVKWGVNTSGKELFELSKLDNIGKGGIHYFNKMGMCFGKHEIAEKVWKVVATTNPELWDITVNKPFDGGYTKELLKQSIPKIPTSFVEVYIKAYNEGNPIKEVLLETVNKDGLTTVIGDDPQFLKLKSDGSVTVHPVKERMYTKKELYSAVYLSFISGRANPQLDLEELDLFINDWFNKNYPE